jgi:hypothetical protein
MMNRRLISDQNFAKFAAATMVSFGIAGALTLKLVGPPPPESRSNEDMTSDEAMLHAMIENAKTSTWQENIENASMAQSRFMLPGSTSSGDEKDRHDRFINDITHRRDEIMEQEEARKKEEKERVERFSTWKRS